MELLMLLPGVGVCATTGTLSLALTPLAVGMEDELAGVWVSRDADGLFWAAFFLPNKNDILRLAAVALKVFELSVEIQEGKWRVRRV